MFLSKSDIDAAVGHGDLIIAPFTSAGTTSVDVHLDAISQALIWDIDAWKKQNRASGHNASEMLIARMDYGSISRRFLTPPPTERSQSDAKVVRRDKSIILRPGGFLLWQTKERIGTPETGAKYICFIEGKSTRARTGLVIHLTAPTIHAAWSGKVTLEMANFGPFDLVLHPGDCVAQVTVAEVRTPLDQTGSESATIGQKSVHGAGKKL